LDTPLLSAASSRISLHRPPTSTSHSNTGVSTPHAPTGVITPVSPAALHTAVTSHGTVAPAHSAMSVEVHHDHQQASAAHSATHLSSPVVHLQMPVIEPHHVASLPHVSRTSRVSASAVDGAAQHGAATVVEVSWSLVCVCVCVRAGSLPIFHEYAYRLTSHNEYNVLFFLLFLRIVVGKKLRKYKK